MILAALRVLGNRQRSVEILDHREEIVFFLFVYFLPVSVYRFHIVVRDDCHQAIELCLCFYEVSGVLSNYGISLIAAIWPCTHIGY